LAYAFAKLNQTAWNAPFSPSRRAFPLFKQYFSILNYDCADAYNWLFWIKPFNQA
jgi:hypothetical protein